MLMFLMILLASVPVLIVSCLMFAGLARKEQAPPVVPPETAAAAAQPRFFASETAMPAGPARFPAEAVLSQIERHVRLEQAAAESFLKAPTPEALRSRTVAPFMN